MRTGFKISIATLAFAVALSAPAHAALVISDKTTRNIECDGHGACKAQAKDAVLNVQAVETMLGQFQAVDIIALGSTKDIVIDAPLNWANSNELILEAGGFVIVKRPIVVQGGGGLSVITKEDGGKQGELAFAGKGNVSFSNCSGGLFIDNARYTLVCDIKTLAADIEQNPVGCYALGQDYDAAGDGSYDGSVVHRDLTGVFEGLGHAVSNLTLDDSSEQAVGFFLFMRGKAADLSLRHFTMQGIFGCSETCGSLAAYNFGSLARIFVSGKAIMPDVGEPILGGIVGSNNGGVISDSHADIVLESKAVSSFGQVGGISGANYGTIDRSYAEGKVTANRSDYGPGGITGYNKGIIENSYSLAKVTQNGSKSGSATFYGGLVGYNDTAGKVITSYAAGPMGKCHTAGGVAGYAAAQSGSFSNVYWNLDDGVSDPANAVTNIPNYPGATGLTTEQLQSGLPEGFDPKIWAQNAAINNGLPYLISNPPVK